ncbi:MAG TPA: R3H domain-containing nucleic acid-binding protein [Thermoanaerobaculia bacterium]|jgi:spoIIIJ-associated protein|nr:R3H domain-containing nucleic acid-binding protein [Thermoanaerobaculia bacterium]
MNEPKRRFFSGDTLQQALIQAANHFHLAPEEISYRSIEKRHGFLKTRRKVLIEVDPESPRRAPGSPPPPPAPARPVLSAPVGAPTPAPPPPPVQAREPRPERRPESAERDRGPRKDRGERGDRGGRDRDRGDRGPRGDRGDRGDRGRYDRPRPAERSADRPERPARAEEDSFKPLPLSSGGLIALPEMPRRPSERYPEATGPMADAAAKSVALLLRVAGLSLIPRILQGEERLEVDLSGEDVDWCFQDDGELVSSVEHLLPRMIRSLAGEAPLVRVDCDNFQEIREERLRSLAQEVAEDVRRKGRPRTLEPMNPADRRIVHITLADDPHVVSESSGDGYFKRVTIRPA